MANYVNNSGQTRLGWRVTTQPVVTPYLTTLLDLYSGAAAAYSLRKLNSTYGGSAIRVRRSSDNTEMNIGFDSDGNLDTYSLSAFVGTGNGFVTTWYDQSGNDRNATQATAANQPSIVSSGIVINLNNKSSISFNGSQFMSTTQNVVSAGSGEYSVFGLGRPQSTPNCLFYIGIPSGNNGIGLNNNYGTPRHYWFGNDYDSGQTFANTNSIFVASYDGAKRYTTINNVTTSANSSGKNTISPTLTIGKLANWGQNLVGYESELVIYDSNKESIRTDITNNINTYYSIYPNPTSVWNLLTAVYSADTIASSSLKTSLVAAYNGESNANDSFGSNNGTAMGGLTYGTGKIGNAFVGNGTTSYIEVGDKFDLGLSSWSYNIWFYPTNLSFNRTLFSKTAWAAGGGRFLLNIESALITFTLTLSDGNYILIRDNSTVLPGSQWINLTVVVDRNDKIKLYYNGVLSTNVVNLGSVNNNLIPYINDNLNNTRPFRIGCGSGTDGFNPETPTRFAQGSIDSFNIWNKVLTQAEITELYNSGNGSQYIGDNFYKPTTNDALGTNNGTAVGGLTYGLGKVGTAFQFNGSNSLVELPTNSMKFTGDFSYSFWVNFASLGGYPTLISNYRNAAGSDYGYFLRMNPSNKLEFWGFATSTNSFAMVSVTTFNTNTWYHVSVTKSASSVKIYVNGALERTNSPGVPITYFSTMYPAIGALYKWNGSLSADFVSNGSKMDAVGIWNKELSASEITELYNSGNGKQYPN